MYSTVNAAQQRDPQLTITVGGGVNYPLIADQLQARNIILAGTLTANIQVQLPLVAADAGAWWIFTNATGGAYTITLTPLPTGTGLVLAQGFSGLVKWDGTNLVCMHSDCAMGGMASRGSNSDITALLGITGGITALGGMNLSGGLNLAGALKGQGQAVQLGRQTKTYPSDANYTALASEYNSPWIEINNGVVLAGRNFVLPLTAGCVWFIYNNSGQTITFIGASGTGVAVATGKRQIIGADGTNIVPFCPPQ